MKTRIAFLMSACLAFAARAEEPSAYLFVHFTGESPVGEQIYFSVSEDGLRWTDLNNSAPVLFSRLGEKGVRDPSIIRSPDGKSFHILATDLRIANGRGWDAARYQGSHSLVFWKSADLVNWSEPWAAEVSSTIPEAGCTWAPEAIFDESTGDYFVYWATISPRDGVREARIYGARTKDFRSFSPPELYIERVGDGVNEKDIIDTQILKVDGAEHAYYRVSRDSQITIEGADRIGGEWERIGDLSHLGYTAREVEGPILFQWNGERKWQLLVDQYAAGKGYLPLVTGDLSDSRHFKVLKAGDYSLGASHKRHGGILNITRAEYDALRERWPAVPATRIEPLGSPGSFLRHAEFRPRFDGEVKPEQDGRWRVVSGLSGAEDGVSLMSVNFPGYYLTKAEGAWKLAPNDGGREFAAGATFQKEAGLSDASAVSFRTADGYLQTRGGALVSGPADDAERKKNATFRLSE